jgi:hypothetical protein
MTTSPQHISRINTLAGDDAYRKEVLMTQAILLERSDRAMEWQESVSTWMREHDLKDNDRFTRGDERMSRIESGLGTVKSGVGDYESVREQVKGARRLILGTVAVLSVIGGAILGVMEIVERWAKT